MPGAPRHPALDFPTTPCDEFRWIWNVFHQLSGTRPLSHSGRARHITNQEILAWCQLNNERLSLRDLDTLRLLDNNWINIRTEFERELSAVSEQPNE